MRNVVRFGYILTISAFLSASSNAGGSIQAPFGVPGRDSPTRGTGATFEVASQVEFEADKLNANPFAKFNRFSEPEDTDSQTCDTDNTGLVTIYTTNSTAQAPIDVKLDGSRVGSLTTYFSDDGPGCRARNAAGVISLNVSAGQHVIEAVSPNLNWPGHRFTVEKCGCMLLPLS